jgi:GTPase SAR1 family protein
MVMTLLPVRTATMALTTSTLFRLRMRLIRWRWRRISRKAGFPVTDEWLAETPPTPNMLPEIAILGEFSAGKSSLVNALIGEANLPTGLTETTGIPARIRYGRSGSAHHVHRSTQSGLETQGVLLSEIPWSTLEPEGELRIELPAPLLRGLTLIDTPGTNTPNAKHRDHATNVASRAAGWVYLTRAEQALRKSEVDWLRVHGAADHSIVLCLSQSDRLAYADLKSVKLAVEQKLAEVGIRPVTCLFVSNIRSFRGAWSRWRLIWTLRVLNAALPWVIQLASTRAARTALEYSFQRSLLSVLDEIEGRSRAYETERAKAEAATKTEWLTAQKSQMMEELSRAQAAVLNDAMVEYDRRRTLVAGETWRMPSVPPVTTAKQAMSSACRAVMRATYACAKYVDIKNDDIGPPFGLGGGRTSRGSVELFYRAESLPRRGVWANLLSLFKSEQENNQDLIELYLSYVEKERIRWATYVRQRFAAAAVELSARIDTIANAESEAANASMRAAETRLRHLNRLEKMVRKHMKSA